MHGAKVRYSSLWLELDRIWLGGLGSVRRRMREKITFQLYLLEAI